MIKRPPVLRTERLILRPFTLDDADAVRRLAGAREIYEMTQNVPHPYEEGMAERWIATHTSQFLDGRGVTLAITRSSGGEVIGAIGLGAAPAHRSAELGYWLGVAYWNNGYTTEAAAELVRYGFQELGYHRIHSRHFVQNPASGRVMQKIGMSREGEFVDEALKDGRFMTLVHYGLINPAER